MVMYTLCNKRSISSHFFFYLQLRFFNEEYNDRMLIGTKNGSTTTYMYIR